MKDTLVDRLEFERVVRNLTQPVNGQYPRPWMTRSKDPLSCRVFIVGRNQRNGFPVAAVDAHEHYIDTLFNRGSESCRELYDRLTRRPSPTRLHIDDLVRKLAKRRVEDVLETNVICYGTPMSRDLDAPSHAGGRAAGKAVFTALLRMVGPKVIVAHGAGTLNDLRELIPDAPSDVPADASELIERSAAGITVLAIPSLAPPEYNKWSGWADGYLERVSERVAQLLSRG